MSGDKQTVWVVLAGGDCPTIHVCSSREQANAVKQAEVQERHGWHDVDIYECVVDGPGVETA